MHKRFSIARVSGVVVALAASSLPAFAAVDISEIEAAGTDILAVGVAVFAVAVGIKLYKWIRRAL